ncbi:hypothetical protein B9Z55_009180 [Caenorhabditis nigoni]|uniref:BTB domain-containing protein n=1 Tax=Caenorhabditis nigoni TaxID=1611254 RepID=A0A2G5UQZ9_9PELO|nr:hypothetical protein B9Z55_009180 [Caenorhabditis nigoni]
MVPEEKRFVIRHVFDRYARANSGPVEMRYNIPWKINVYEEYLYEFYLYCLPKNGQPGWFIDIDYEMKLVGKHKSFEVKGSERFDERNNNECYSLKLAEIKRYIVEDKLKVEWHVKINKMAGFEDSGVFEDPNSAVFVVEKEKFKVDKKFLADNCTYFNTLFFETFDACGRSEIEIEDCEKNNFQSFLKILKCEEDIDEKSINGVLELSAKFGSNSMLTKCEEFLIQKSKTSINIKFNAAIKYKLNKLNKKCLSDIKTKKDMTEIASENADHFTASVWKQLLKKSITIN